MGIALNTLLMIVVALSIPGVINRTRAILAGRKGLPFVQHIRNVRLLLRKGSVYSTTTTALFRIAPAVYLGAAIVAMLFMPVADLYPLISFEGDVICFAYTLALARVAIILAAMDTGSSFEGMGAAREALYGALIEPALMIGFATLAMFCGYTSFADIFAHEQSFNAQLTIVMFLIAYLFISIAFVESGRVPVDDPRTHLELTMIHEVMCLDAQMRAATEGKASIDDVVLKILDVARAGGPLSNELFLQLVREIASIDVTDQHKQMCDGVDFAPLPNSFDGHFTNEPVQAKEADTGKDVTSYQWSLK